MSNAPACQGNSPYETWVLTLQAWTKDPMTSLEGLPALQDDTFTPQTYNRLFVYVKEALEAATARWEQELLTTLRSFRSSFDLAQGMTRLRSTLARRVQLARHPGLPPGWRKILGKDATKTIQRLQDDFERIVRNSTASWPQAERELMYRTVRENSFVRVLEMDLAQDGRRQTMSALPVIQADPSPAPRRGYRRLPPLQ